ncbi:CUE domain-containing protein 1 isoform X2 [Choloepus didactylus]|uniref:CUE domain-containing protein 1 isoform X2 n=1 Tax=Choloepus didactylus TaxID=27675 RepID=UPI00189EF86D|nr:CUE domain-containing protein 1 isoform X2 [Choloepus didactylus]
MTSLFRRSSSGSGGGGGGGARGGGGSAAAAAAQELNNSRPARQVRRLEFNQAMDDFKTMFPSMDYDIIECVLRANSGAVDATIDQLLQMNLEGGGGSVYEDSSDSEDSIPPEILERTLEPDSSDEEPPPVYSPPAYHMHMFDRPHPLAPPTPPPRIDMPGSGPAVSQRCYRNWNPPLLGNLPDDFLRILPQQLDSVQGNPGGSKPVSVSREGGPPCAVGAGTRDQESRWKQYLEDERIALFLQNEEFMKELQRNRDFLLALERDVCQENSFSVNSGFLSTDRLKYESQKSKSSSVAVGNDYGFPSPVPAVPSSCQSSSCRVAELPRGACSMGPSEANPAVSEDALFRDKLKHMGKSTRRKLFELARAFSEKTKMRKSKRKHLLKHQALGAAASTANLLDDVEGHACDEGFQGRRQEVPKVEETLREGQ